VLHEFIATNRAAIISRAREKVTDRPWPLSSTSELEHGVPLFLSQLVETLRSETTSTPASPRAIGESAAKHGRELRELGFSISQVVHDYGDICQAITEVALEQQQPIRTEEFHTLNRRLDTAIAEAVTEHARITAESRATEEVERSGQLAHEIRDLLNTSLLAFHTLKTGVVAINGSTGTVLGRSLLSLRDLVENTLSDVRMGANIQRTQRVPIAAFLSEIAVAGHLHAENRTLGFVIDPVDPELTVSGDPQVLGSAVMNLLNNAFKYTRAGGQVMLRALRRERHVQIEVEDECGGLPERTDESFKAFSERRMTDRTGLGLGLSIARKAVKLHQGDIHVRNLPGKGCVFIIELPLAGQEASVRCQAAVTPTSEDVQVLSSLPKNDR
jgi:signal transduction histidine kinase